jgi:hypothetical protein
MRTRWGKVEICERCEDTGFDIYGKRHGALCPECKASELPRIRYEQRVLANEFTEWEST